MRPSYFHDFKNKHNYVTKMTIQNKIEFKTLLFVILDAAGHNVVPQWTLLIKRNCRGRDN